MLDTNIISDLARNPSGAVAKHIAEVGPEGICVSIITAAELRYGCAKKGSPRLLAQIEAILDGVPLLVPGAEGLHSVELANAMLYSSLLGQTLELPMDGVAFERKLGELIAASKVEKKVVAITGDDFTQSFHR